MAADLTSAAKAAFVHGSNVANVVAALVVLVAAALALRYMPRTRGMDRAVHPDAELIIVDPDAWVQPEASRA